MTGVSSRAAEWVVAAAVVAWGAVLPTVSGSARVRVGVTAAAAGAAVGAARAAGISTGALGLAPAAVPSGLAWGAAAAVPPLVGAAVSVAVPSLRARLEADARGGRHDFAEWIGVHIPLGTVLPEELLFRGVVQALVGTGPQAAAFGLWHVRGARAAGENVVSTVLATAAAGGVFGVLRARSGSIVAPILGHAAINVGGALAVRVAHRLRAERDRSVSGTCASPPNAASIPATNSGQCDSLPAS